MTFWLELTDIITNFILIVATIVGGWWAYFQFNKFRRPKEIASVTHSVDITQMPEEQLFVRLEVKIKNIGKVLLEIDHGGAYAQQILPCDPARLAVLAASARESNRKQYPKFDWPLIGDERLVSNWGIKLEPGETEIINFDFLFPNSLKTFTLYSFFFSKRMVQSKLLDPWSSTTAHNVRPYEPPPSPPPKNGSSK